MFVVIVYSSSALARLGVFVVLWAIHLLLLLG